MKIDDLENVIVDDEFDHGLSSRLDNVSVIGVTKLEKTTFGVLVAQLK